MSETEEILLPESFWEGTRQLTGGSYYAPLTEFISNAGLERELRENAADHARAVAYIRRDDGAGGTGFLVAPDLLLTNQHVLRTPEDANTCQVWFGYDQAAVAGNQQHTDLYSCTASGPGGFFYASPAPDYVRGERVDADHLDFALVRIKTPVAPGTKWNWVPLTGYWPDSRPGMELTIIQHPQHKPTYVGYGADQLKWRNDVVIQYITDTHYGSSGAPVFNKFWQVVGLHHARVALANSGLKGNQAIFVTAIVNHLVQRAIPVDLPAKKEGGEEG